MDTLEHVLYGALLHDVGKVIQRSGEDRREHALCGAEALNAAGVPKAVVDCARYHHASALGGASLPPDHPAYIVYVADNIAAGTDRRGAESPDAAGFKAMMPLSAVFRQLGGEPRTEQQRRGQRQHGEPTGEPLPGNLARARSREQPGWDFVARRCGPALPGKGHCCFNSSTVRVAENFFSGSNQPFSPVNELVR